MRFGQRAVDVRAINQWILRTAKVSLMNSSFLSMVSSAPRTLSAISVPPCCSTRSISSMMAASRASWLSLNLDSKEGSRSEFGMAVPPWSIKSSSRFAMRGMIGWQDAGKGVQFQN